MKRISDIDLVKLAEWLKSDDAKERRKNIKESSERLSKYIRESLNVSDELLKSKITI